MTAQQSNRQRWFRVLAEAANPSTVDRRQILQEALLLSTDIDPAIAGCSVTELVEAGYRTSLASGPLPLVLDQAQYDGGTGPCMVAARDQHAERIDDIGIDGRYQLFAAACSEEAVRSSLSLPLGTTRSRSALNLYSTKRSTFAGPRAAKVAALLAGAMSELLPGRDLHSAEPAAHAADLRAARARATLIGRAKAKVIAEGELSEAQAFQVLRMRSAARSETMARTAEHLLAQPRADTA